MRGDLFGLAAAQWIDVVQTAVLVVIAVAVIYAVALLRRELQDAGVSLRQVTEGRRHLIDALNRAFSRIEALEERLGIRPPPREPPP